MGRPKEKLKQKKFRLPELQKKILDETKWEDHGFINDSDMIRRSIDRTLEELGLLKRNSKSS